MKSKKAEKEEIITNAPNPNHPQSPSKTLCSIMSSGDGPFDRFQHIKSTKISNFYSYSPSTSGHQLIHFQGGSAPICTFQSIHRGSDREYHRLLIPPIYDG